MANFIIHNDKRNNSPENLELYSGNAEHLRDDLKRNFGKCIIPNCENQQRTRNMCKKNYIRVINQGNPYINLKKGKENERS